MKAIILNHDHIYGKLVYTFLLVSTLGIIFFAIFFREPLKKGEMIFHYFN